MNAVKIFQPVTLKVASMLRQISDTGTHQEGFTDSSGLPIADFASTDSTALIAFNNSLPVGAVYLAKIIDDQAKGSVIISRNNPKVNVDLELAKAAVDFVYDNDIEYLELWGHGPTGFLVEAAAEAGLISQRELHEMEIPLPLENSAKFSSEVTVRTFIPGDDEEPWLKLNHRSFVNDPDQGQWTRETLAERMSRPWFDPELFIIIEADETIIGSCWVQIHPASSNREKFGEIYVIGVDPDYHGRGLGRALVEAGLALIAKNDCAIGTIFVDVKNTTAFSLYQKIGFTDRRIDRLYVWTSPTEKGKSG